MANRETVRAQISAAILDKADRLFRNDDEGLWIELLQNSRRSGATVIEVSVQETRSQDDECLVVVADDGHGIQDFQRLLTLGDSGWDTAIQQREQPAGMGFFSLCRSETEVRS